MEPLTIVGRRVPRLDSVEKVTGKTQYTKDVRLPRMLHGKILRSPHAHARILHIDISRAKSLVGVKSVLTAADMPRKKETQFAQASQAISGYAMTDESFKRIPFSWELIFASDRVRYVGEEVAAVAAVDPDTAEEALRLIRVEYEELPAVFDPEEALLEGAPQLHPAECNIVAENEIWRGDVEEGFRESDYIFEDRFVTPVVHQCYLEPFSCVSSFDAYGKLTVWTSSMYPSGYRLSLAKALNLDESDVRVVQTAVGGAFGAKIRQLPLHSICALLAKNSGRPVRLANSREEDLISTRPRVATVIYLKTGVKRDGTLLAKETRVICNNGAYLERAPAIMRRMTTVMDSLYRYRSLHSLARCVYTNTTPAGAFRGFGAPQMAFAVESQMDMIAERLGIDPIELRLKNSVQKGDLTIHGWKINSCGIKECMLRTAEKIGWKEKRGKKVPRRGIGLANMMFVSEARLNEGFGGSIAYIKILEDGKVEVVTGEADYGQGAHTIYAQIAAEVLGLPVSRFRVPGIDTDITPFTLGPWGDRLTISGGEAVRLAALDAKDKLLKLAAQKLEANLADLEMEGGKISVKGTPARAVTIAELATYSIYRTGGGSTVVGCGVDERETEVTDPKTLYGNVSSAYTFATQAAEVEVDPETGQVKVLRFCATHDLGRTINPLLAEGQIEGSAAQGIGFALSEELWHHQGRVMNPSFLDYKLPTALDLPPVDVIFVESMEPSGPFGAKAVAEPGLIPTAPAIANAIYDAVGVRIREIPVSPERLRQALGAKDRTE